MKRVFSIIIVVFLMVALCHMDLPGKKDKTKNPAWKALKKAQLKQVRVFDNPDKSLNTGTLKNYVIDMTLIRAALEKSGLNETVKMDIYDRRVITELGEYTPTVETVEGKTVVKFDAIPPTVKAAVVRPPATLDTAADNRMDSRLFWLPDRCTIRFKNAEGKVQARTTISFQYFSR